MKKYLLGSFIISAMLIPVLANAATADEIRVQIQALLAQIEQLQKQLVNHDTGTTVKPPVPPAIGGCPNLLRTLSRGSRGSDVISLQQFLIAQGFLSSDSATGFFGSMTEVAVQRWQAGNSIVSNGGAASTGYGVVGARTRSAIMARCNSAQLKTSCPARPPAPCAPGTTLTWDTDANGCRVNDRCLTKSEPPAVFSASKTMGEAPLTVRFTVYKSGSFGFIFDDESSQEATINTASRQTLDHTFALPGTYSVRLMPATTCNDTPTAKRSPSASCYIEPVGTVTITVTGTQGVPSISITLPKQGTSISKGDMLNLSWSSQNARVRSRIRFEIYPETQVSRQGFSSNDFAFNGSGKSFELDPTGTFESYWHRTLADGRYRIVAKLYETGVSDHCWNDLICSNPPEVYATGESGIFTIAP